jgi:uncharacterized protein YpmS
MNWYRYSFIILSLLFVRLPSIFLYRTTPTSEQKAIENQESIENLIRRVVAEELKKSFAEQKLFFENLYGKIISFTYFISCSIFFGGNSFIFIVKFCI